VRRGFAGIQHPRIPILPVGLKALAIRPPKFDAIETYRYRSMIDGLVRRLGRGSGATREFHAGGRRSLAPSFAREGAGGIKMAFLDGNAGYALPASSITREHRRIRMTMHSHVEARGVRYLQEHDVGVFKQDPVNVGVGNLGVVGSGIGIAAPRGSRIFCVGLSAGLPTAAQETNQQHQVPAISRRSHRPSALHGPRFACSANRSDAHIIIEPER
jgi:hypothetical protein